MIHVELPVIEKAQKLYHFSGSTANPLPSGLCSASKRVVTLQSLQNEDSKGIIQSSPTLLLAVLWTNIIA